MKYKLQLLLCSLLLSLGAFSQTIPSYVPTNGLVGWWPFNGNANDESGNGNHGTVQNGTNSSSDRYGTLNSAFDFDGNDDQIYVNHSANISPSQYVTVNSWIYPRAYEDNKFILVKGSHINLYYRSYGLLGPESNQKAQFRLSNSNVELGVYSNSIIPLNTWSMITGVYDGTNLKIYVNGVFDGQISMSGLINQTNEPLSFGSHKYYNFSDYWYNGSLDDISIYNRVLTQQEITALYNGPTYTINASSGSNGSITPSGITTLNSTATQRYTFTANSGYMLDSVIVDGNKVDSVSGYTFSSLTSNHTIRVTYKALNIPSYVPTNGLVGWWPFNGNANDESGNGNHGTVNGATLTSDRNGVLNKSFEFNGIHKDNIGISLLNSLNNDVTISLWYFSNSSNGGPFVHIGQDNPGTPFCDGFDIGKGGTSLNNSGNNLISGFSCIGYYNSNIQGLTGSWNHVVLVKLNNKVKISLNGILVSDIATISVINPSPYVFFASTSSLNSTFFTGSLDDIAIYNRALSQKEITALYTGVVTKDIVASSGANGSISPSGTNSVNSGSNQTYTFTPNPGYWIDSVIVNGVQVPTASSYTFNNVTSDQSIRVTYRSLAAALAAANICSNDTIVSTLILPAQSNVRATSYYSNIYLFNQNNTNNAYKYNVNDRKYTAIANKPTVCIECGVAEANGKIYCFNTNGTSVAYDIASNTWQTLTNQTSTSTSSVYAASINNKIYVLGYNNNQNTFTQYNPQTNSYTALTNPTTSTSQSRLVAFNNKLYKIGGTDNNNQPTASVEVYNPTNNTWTAMPDLPVALSQVGATYYNNKLYVFGGKQASNTTNSNKVYVFDFTSNAWYAESNTQNTNKTNIEAKTANGLVYLFGGSDSTNTTTNQAQRYFCKDQLCTCKWAEYVCNGVSSDVPCPTSSLYRPGTVFCNGNATKVVEVTNPITGKTWMDRNLGASRAATSSTDTLAYGDLYQWGRGADGHQCRNSGTTTTLSTTDQPGHGNFILAPNYPYDWKSIQNDSLWQGVNGINNPCPSGYRIPTSTELDAERTSWNLNNINGAFNSALKLTLSGNRDYNNGLQYNLASYGLYWSSSKTGIFSIYLNLNFAANNAYLSYSSRAASFSVRCIKD